MKLECLIFFLLTFWPHHVINLLFKWWINEDIFISSWLSLDVFIVAVGWQSTIKLRWHVLLLITANDTLPLWVTNVPITCGVYSPLALFSVVALMCSLLPLYTVCPKHIIKATCPSLAFLSFALTLQHVQTFHHLCSVSCWSNGVSYELLGQSWYVEMKLT